MSRGIRILPARCPEKTDDWVIVFSFCFFSRGLPVTIRMHIDTLRTMGRAAQGVKLINLKGTSEIAAVARVPRSEEEEDAVVLDENGEVI